MVRGKRAAAQQSGKQPAAKRGRPAKARALADPGPGPATMEDNDSAGPSRAPSPILPVIRQGRRATRTTGNQRQQELPGGSGHGAGWQQRPTEASIPSAADEDTDFSDEAEEIQGSEDDRATHQPWSNSTALPVRRQRNVSEQSFIDPADRLSAAIERTLAAVREASLAGERSSRLVNRLTTAKALPSFSGDPLEWLHFKEAYILSSESGGYSDRENIARLFDALKGEARDVVKTLLASSRDADTIIKTLELHFGNKRAAAEKIVAELKTLPEIDSGRISLVQFATKLRSAVVAFKTFRLLGYLHSPELVKSVGHKIPIALRYAYNRYAVSVREEKSELEKLADFIYAEAELATEAGIFDIDFTTERPTQRVDRGAFGGSRRPSAKTAVVCVAERRDRRVEANATETRKCAFCKKDNHPSPKCLFFAREPVSKRWDLVKKYNLCFGCLRPGHSRNDCKSEMCKVCKRQHHILLHKYVDANSAENEAQCGAISGGETVRAGGPKRTIDTFALLDEGSTVTLIDDRLARDLGVKGSRIDVSIKGIGEGEIRLENSKKVDFDVEGIFGTHRIRGAITVKNLKFPTQSISRDIIARIHDAAKDVEIRPYHGARVELLIGQDNWDLIVTRELREIIGTDLAVSRSRLGWTVHGSAKCSSRAVYKIDVSEYQCTGEALTSLDDLVKGYFALEYTGIKDSVACKGEQDRALRILEETSSRKGKIWETGLLWKDDHAPSTNGLSTARKRLELLERRLDRDPEYARLYYQEMQRFLDQGYAQRVEKTLERTRTWYLPHFGVRNVNKPNKVRLVFDAAAKTGGISLNDQLMSGPDLLKSLPGILIRFRQYAFAVKADISDMFLRVQIRESDRGAQRFLWRGKDRNREPDIYEMSTLIFGAKSSPCSAIYVKDKNAKDCNEAHPEAVRSIINDSYMDDFLSSRRTVREAAELVRDVIAINARANFAMHGWASNKAEALRNSVDHGQRLEQGDMRLGDRGGERVLGLFWDTQTDELKFNVELKNIPKEILLGERKPTKREFLRVIMSVFDPLGILAPFTLKSKIIMQEIWRSGINWDDPLREEDFVRWRKWVSMIDRVKECRMPRCYGVTESRESEAQLHVFCDASLTAYAAVAYLRFENENESESAHVSLIMAKSRVAPLKPLTIPRLELQAALMGTRLAIFDYRDFVDQIGAADASSIRSEPFRRNRGKHADDGVAMGSGQNPADDATRFENSSEFISPRWFEGPEFLRRPESEWPIEKTLTAKEKATIDGLEQRKACVYVAATVKAEFSLPIRLMGWRGLLVIARRVHAIVGRWKGKNTVIEPLEIVQIGEQYWYRVIQEEYFGAEIVALRNGRNINKGSKIAGLNPYVDEQGILRANGRVTATGLEGFDNRPIILEGRHPATKLLIAEYHRKFYHASSDAVVNELRQKYHIIGLRRVLRSLISRCIVCRIRRGRPQNPLMSALPVGRVAFRQRPFTHCGVDYFGPLMVKIGRRREKRWGVLFTCLTTRAIHLEIAHSLSASSAIMALQRLAARRGTPQVVYSDNGTNFRGADKELKDATASMDRAKIEEYALSKRVKWVFNPPDAPHMGGAWERLIRSVKTALNVILREQAPSEEVLSTLFAEAEHSVNSRPLTHVSLDPRDKEALTPNHFLIGSSSGEIQLGRYDLQNVCLRKQRRTAQSFAEAFWKRWLREYLPTLVPRKKWTEKENPLEVGDIVLIVDLQAPRNSWRKGTVTRVFPGVDKEVRVAEHKKDFNLQKSNNKTYLNPTASTSNQLQTSTQIDILKERHSQTDCRKPI
ncbi:uncharacterized protein LOC143263989 [Megachile rotundata]|uniref:uncharacterized protein LOC143263989 n=1 Tax=Megachile rotundata TaxID=143995 RepID=UPI003FD3BC1E